MSRIPNALALLALVVLVSAANAGIRPSFSERYSSWHATHVVVVDAKGKVLESWKGDLKKGDILPMDRLALPKEKAISTPFGKKDAPPKRVTDSRIVLYLIRQADGWKPASLFGGMQVSLAWIEKDGVYAFVQWINPGPTELILIGATEKKMRQTVEKGIKVKTALDKAAADVDPSCRAEGMVAFLDMKDIYGPSWDAWEILDKCGKSAGPTLRSLLNDPKRLSMHPCVIEALGKAVGEGSREDLLAVVKEELNYWKKTGPTLKTWWGREPMTSHYSRLHEALRQLGKFGVADDQRKVITEIRDFWESLPQLDEIGKGTSANGKLVGKSQIVAAAETVVGRKDP